MTEYLTQEITLFLENNTNDALLIRGDHGTGKTYYIKNTLFPKLGKTIIPTSISNENYHPILISLFGVRSVEEIQKQLFLALLPLLKNKSVKITSETELFLIQLFCKIDIKQLLNQEQLLSELLLLSKNKSASIFSKIGRLLSKIFSKTKNIVPTKVKILLCFDDINRKSNALHSKELFGFINTILEHTNMKVILVETKDELTNVDADYLQMKEKVIGDSVIFETDFPVIYEQIITEKYKEKSSNYYDFLHQRSQDLISKIEESNSNLETLLFFLDHYEAIFTAIKELLKQDEHPNLSEGKYFSSTFNYALSISIELKIGRLTPDIIFNLKHRSDESNLMKSPLDGELTPKELETYEAVMSYLQNYEDKYVLNKNYKSLHFFNSIFDYIVGHSPFIPKNLVPELIPHRIVNEYPLFNKLFELEGIDLPMSEVEDLIDEMLNLVDTAAFHFSEYANVFEIVKVFFYTPRRVSMIDIDELKETEKALIQRFKKGIDTWVTLHYNAKDYPEFDANFSILQLDQEKVYFRNPFKHHVIQLIEKQGIDFNRNRNEIHLYSLEVFDKIKGQNEKKEIESLIALHKKDLMAFIEKISDQNTSLGSYPIYSEFDIDEFWALLKKMKNSQLVKFGLHLEQRYQKHIPSSLGAEKHFLVALEKKLKKEMLNYKNPLHIEFDEITIRNLREKVGHSINLLND